jgi:putative two-component system response regulator
MNDTNEKKVILVVDDTPENIDVLAGILKVHYKVKVAKDGDKALQIANKSPPDLILLDVMMPGMSGYEVCARLKAAPQTRDIPVIFVTGMSDPTDRTKGMELGAIGFFSKPVDADVVTAKVRELLA